MSTGATIPEGRDPQAQASCHRGGPVRPDPALWELPDIHAALAVRDITTLFRLLGQHQISQRRIAALVGMSQSEVSEIAGGRQVRFYDLFARIADGLGIPRGYLGLADQLPLPAATGEPAPHDRHFDSSSHQAKQPTPQAAPPEEHRPGQQARDRSARANNRRGRKTASRRAGRPRRRGRDVD